MGQAGSAEGAEERPGPCPCGAYGLVRGTDIRKPTQRNSGTYCDKC